MDKYVCIHGHFYQPPRENPWIEEVEIQDSARPYHDWNERVSAECYAPNQASRILGDGGKITEIVNNYASISFNFGPTLLSWMERKTPVVYASILEADRISRDARSGHGNAIAQAYNHIIMPLADSRMKRTQIIWGIRDFEHRFDRFPEGMWLPETAVDLEALEIMAAEGIRYTILAPHQAAAVRKIGEKDWTDVTGSKIDPSRPYLCPLPSGRAINIFFYDGPISLSVAFENLLKSGVTFSSRIMAGFAEERGESQLVNIATDGETYGHHQKFGDMALAYALQHIQEKELARITNYGEFLELYPPTHQVQVLENTSWSCMHGVERWRSGCGCQTGGPPEWNQDWRGPLRKALDWLQKLVEEEFQKSGKKFLRDPDRARNDYIQLVLDRSPERKEEFFERHATRTLTADEKRDTLRLMEMVRHAMLMYTSCGWFFAELSGIETVQVIQYAGRTLQLYRQISGHDPEEDFLMRLSFAKSNLPEMGDGARIFRRSVKPTMVDLLEVGVHHAISDLFNGSAAGSELFAYATEIKKSVLRDSGRFRLFLGRMHLSSRITLDDLEISFCVIHLGHQSLNAGVSPFRGEAIHASMELEIVAAFESGDIAKIIRLMDSHFQEKIYTLTGLFRDRQREIVDHLLQTTMEEMESAYRGVFESNRIFMGFLNENNIPVPLPFRMAAQLTLNADLLHSLNNGRGPAAIPGIIGEINKWNLPVDSVEVEFAARNRLERQMLRLADEPDNLDVLRDIILTVELAGHLPVQVNHWESQNLFFDLIRNVYPSQQEGLSGERGRDLYADLRRLADLLDFDPDIVPLFSRSGNSMPGSTEGS